MRSDLDAITASAPRSPGGGWPAGFVRTREDRRALLVLSALEGLRPRRLLELARELGSPGACLAAVVGGREGSDADREWARKIDPRGLEAALRSGQARMVVPESAEYLAGLEDLADPPAALFVRGASLASMPSRVAVVGARRCSPLGREIATEIGAGLARAGICVVSGAAIGIDTAAQEGALRGGGLTIAVLGCGVDQAYPPRNRPLLERVARSGCVASEYPPGVPALPFRFPARNRIIAALAEAVVVVEGARGSGSLITADHALDLGRAVYAVPGAVTSPLSEVPLALIRDGAGMIRGAADLLADIGRLDPSAAPSPMGAGPAGSPAAGPGPGMSEAEREVLSVLSGPTLPEHVARSVGRPLAEVVPVLVTLELRGLIRNVGGRVERRLASAPG